MAVRFSVYIPVWNDAIWLGGAIESVLAQTHKDWELVIGDNASVDDIGTVIAFYDDPRIRYHRWPSHTDIYENNNRTGTLCRHEWIQVLGADDRLRPRCLERMAERIELGAGPGRRLAMVVTAVQPVFADGRAANGAFFGLDGPILLGDGVYDGEAWLRHATLPGHVPWSVMSTTISREVAAEAGATYRLEHGVAADLELALRMGAFGDVAYVAEPLCHVTVRSDSDAHQRGAISCWHGESHTSIGSSLLSALRVHEARRSVTKAERRAVFVAVARTHLRRAAQHRSLSAGRGWWPATLDVARAFRCSPSLFASPRDVIYAMMFLMAPAGLLRLARKRMMIRRFGEEESAVAPESAALGSRRG